MFAAILYTRHYEIVRLLVSLDSRRFPRYVTWRVKPGTTIHATRPVPPGYLNPKKNTSVPLSVPFVSPFVS